MKQIGPSDPYYVTVLLWLARTAFFAFVCTFLLWLGIGIDTYINSIAISLPLRVHTTTDGVKTRLEFLEKKLVMGVRYLYTSFRLLY